MWEKLGYTDMMVSKSQWPQYNKENVDAMSIQSEELLQKTMDDILHILKVAKTIDPQKIIIYVDTDQFKSKIYHKILEIMMVNGQNNMGAIMKELIADPQTTEVKKIPDYVQKIVKDLQSESEEIKRTKLESKEFVNEKEFLSKELPSICKKEFNADVIVYSKSDKEIYDPKGRAKHARLFKPAILIE